MPKLPKYMIYPIAKAGLPRVMNGDTKKFHLPHITNPNWILQKDNKKEAE